jgi:hypothetical protein
MEVFDILNEIDEKGRLRNVLVGGYVVKRLAQPSIFTTEEIEPNGKFVDFKLIYITNSLGKRVLTAGHVVAFVPDNVVEKDFYEFKGTLSLAGYDYTRVVTMMTFSKKEVSETDRTIWVVHPVKVSDMELSHLSTDLYNVVMDFVEAPLSYKNEWTKHILQPKAEERDSGKVYYDFKVRTNKVKYPLSKKRTEEFEKAFNYLVDPEYEIVREGLRFPVLTVNLTDFQDKMLLKYMEWLMDGNIKVVESLDDVVDDGHYIVLVDKEIDNVPYIELKKGVWLEWA